MEATLSGFENIPSEFLPHPVRLTGKENIDRSRHYLHKLIKTTRLLNTVSVLQHTAKSFYNHTSSCYLRRTSINCNWSFLLPRLDLSMAAAVDSSIQNMLFRSAFFFSLCEADLPFPTQVALFVIPVLALLGWCIKQPLTFCVVGSTDVEP
jgi:hypothetical protein